MSNRSLDELSVLAASAVSRRRVLAALMIGPVAAWADRVTAGGTGAAIEPGSCGAGFWLCEAGCQAKKAICLSKCAKDHDALTCLACLGELADDCTEKCHKSHCPCPPDYEMCLSVCCPPDHVCFGNGCVPKTCPPCQTKTWGGNCAYNCAYGESCCNGQCIASDQFCCHNNPCPNDHLCCTDGCVDPTSDQACGTCDNACAFGEDCCNGSCANLSGDQSNCGSCGNECEAGESCVNGTCSCGVTCPDDYTCCWDQCVYTGGGCWMQTWPDVCIRFDGCNPEFNPFSPALYTQVSCPC